MVASICTLLVTSKMCGSEKESPEHPYGLAGTQLHDGEIVSWISSMLSNPLDEVSRQKEHGNGTTSGK
jgi:hypothetical protein